MLLYCKANETYVFIFSIMYLILSRDEIFHSTDSHHVKAKMKNTEINLIRPSRLLFRPVFPILFLPAMELGQKQYQPNKQSSRSKRLINDSSICVFQRRHGGGEWCDRARLSQRPGAYKR